MILEGNQRTRSTRVPSRRAGPSADAKRNALQRRTNPCASNALRRPQCRDLSCAKARDMPKNARCFSEQSHVEVTPNLKHGPSPSCANKKPGRGIAVPSVDHARANSRPVGRSGMTKYAGICRINAGASAVTPIPKRLFFARRTSGLTLTVWLRVGRLCVEDE